MIPITDPRPSLNNEKILNLFPLRLQIFLDIRFYPLIRWVMLVTERCITIRRDHQFPDNVPGKYRNYLNHSMP